MSAGLSVAAPVYGGFDNSSTMNFGGGSNTFKPGSETIGQLGPDTASSGGFAPYGSSNFAPPPRGGFGTPFGPPDTGFAPGGFGAPPRGALPLGQARTIQEPPGSRKVRNGL